MSSNNWKFNAASLSKVEELSNPSFAKGYTIAWFGKSAFGASNTTANLKKNWESGQGAFVFLKAGFEEVKASNFEQSLLLFLAAPIRQNISFLWIENPLDKVEHWKTNSISTLKEGAKFQISQRCYLDLKNYSFSLARFTEIVLNGSTFEFKRSNSNPHAFELNSGFGAHRLYSIGDTVKLPMKDDAPGCLQFDLRIDREGNADGTFGYPALSHLDLSIRMFMRDPDFPEAGDSFYISSHRYPIFDEDSDYDAAFPYYRPQIDFEISLDFLYPEIEDRSYFDLSMPVDEFKDIGYPSGFRTNLGYSIHLLPTASSKFVFAGRPNRQSSADIETASLYLVPSGDFKVVVPHYNEEGTLVTQDEESLICGISGVEYVKISDKNDSALQFIPGQAAFLPSYVSAAALMRDLGTILESFSARSLPPDTTDLDMAIEDKQEGESNEAMDINDTEREQILEIIRKDYFPPNYQFTQEARDEYMSLEIVEELVDWLRLMLQAARIEGVGEGALLTKNATTSWAYLTDPDAAVYYAQPDQAILYKAESSSREFLDFMEVPAVGLPISLTDDQRSKLETLSGAEVLAFPMLPYGNVDRFALTDMRQLEIQVISNFRRNRIQMISQASDHLTSLKTTDAAAPITGTTPQGLLATFSPDCKDIDGLMLAKDTSNKEVKFVNIEHGSALKASLQSNQLFMVMTDPEAIRANFATEVLQAIPNATNRLEIEKWIFELGPFGKNYPDDHKVVEERGKPVEHWAKKGTIFIFKFHDKPLIELAEDPELWSMAGDFNINPQKASRDLKRLLTKAIESGKSSDPKERRKYEVLARAATYAGWSGIIALNVDVPLGNLPDDLKALAAGINADEFFAQYVGIEVTQVLSNGTNLLPQQSSLFGLIDYQNENIPVADPSGYNFHVRFLTVVFQNSQITDFAAEILLIIDKLFDERSTLLNSPDGRNILTLKGVAEEHNGKVTYSFGFSGANRFQLSGKVIQEVEIVKAQFATDPVPAADANGDLTIKGRFSLWARMRFAYLEELDILSFGPYPQDVIAGPPKPTDEIAEPDYLNMSNLQVVMSFDLNEISNDVSNKQFEFNPFQIAYDLKRSGWRKHSLFEKFPLKFKTLRYVKGDSNALANSGFMPVKSGLRKSLAKDEMGDTWYALVFDLNMGSIGSLAGGSGLVVGIMAAWKPGEEGLYVGLKLPGSSGGKKEISIQGVLKIVFKHIQFVTYPLLSKDPETMTPEEKQQVGYLLKLKNIVLKFFVVSFPPVGKTEIILFGDPREEVAREDKLVGWYAAYKK